MDITAAVVVVSMLEGAKVAECEYVLQKMNIRKLEITKTKPKERHKPDLSKI